MNAIIGFAKVIKEEELGEISPKDYKELAADIHSSGEHLLKLINDILDFSKAKEDKLDINTEELDAVRLLKICIKMVEMKAAEKAIAIDFSFSDKDIIINSDPKRLKQVIINLLSNAVKFTQNDGKITMSITLNKDLKEVDISVKDTGIGMEAQDIAKALSEFGQVENDLGKKYDGTGLGLPLSKKMVELMGGEMIVNSKVGVGTTVDLKFKDCLPL